MTLCRTSGDRAPEKGMCVCIGVHTRGTRPWWQGADGPPQGLGVGTARLEPPVVRAWGQPGRKGLTPSGRARGPLPRQPSLPANANQSRPPTIATVSRLLPGASLSLLPKRGLGASAFAALLAYICGNKQKPRPEREREILYFFPTCLETCPPRCPPHPARGPPL